MAAFAVACDIAWSMPPVKASAALELCGRRVKGERKHQEQVTDLRNRRIGDQELESLLLQGDDAAEYNGRCSKRTEELRAGRTEASPA